MTKLVVLLIVAVLALSYCAKNIGGPTKSYIDALLKEELDEQASKSQIEFILKNNGFEFVFDDVFNRYQVVRTDFDESCFRTVLYDCGIQIYIYLNGNGTYESHEVLVLYDGL